MLYLVVGKPGEGKTYWTVSTVDEQQTQNEKNFEDNIKTIEENDQILLGHDLKKLINEYEQLKQNSEDENYKDYVALEDDAIDELLQCFARFKDYELFDEYFEYHVYYNRFVDDLEKFHSIKLNKLKPYRIIYTDISGMRREGVRVAPDDWRATPRGSIIVYDEFQYRDAFKWEGNKLSKDPMIIDISKIRHNDRDLYLITQDSDNLHRSLRKLVDKLYFIKRPSQKPKCCSLYVFDQFLVNPRAASDSQRDPKKYVDYKLIYYKDSVSKLYDSAFSHTSMRFSLNWKFVLYTLFFILLLSIVAIGLFKVPIFHSFIDAAKAMTGQKTDVNDVLKPTLSPHQQQNQAAPTQQELQNSGIKDVNVECRMAENMNKEVCKKWLSSIKSVSDMSNPNSSSQPVSSASTPPVSPSAVTVSYDPADPFDDSDIKKKISYTVVNQPKFSGCMKTRNGYRAYTEQGTYLKTSKSVCDRLMKDSSDRPYDYFSHRDKTQLSSQPTFKHFDSQKSDDKQQTDDEHKDSYLRIHHLTDTHDTFNNPRGV